jgi:hypothetical protein
MPLRPKKAFTYRFEDKHFVCGLKKLRCLGKARQTEKQCTRETYLLPYCWQHMKKIDGVVAQPSTIPNAGMGLFACDPESSRRTVVFKTGDFITQYAGETLTQPELDERYGKDGLAPYAWAIPGRDDFLDAACVRSIGALANSHHGTRQKPNAEIEIIGDENLSEQRRARKNALRAFSLPKKMMGLVATRPIYNGDEVLVDYGPEYFKGFSDVTMKTTGLSKHAQQCSK